ncbi:hypothetical protein B7R54_00280 [Subtercola boreus]|uniref:FHA domain-containing protein n=1 Tax=Subtercola boreus TaxID=120213 RepID=A0A3E0VDT6_9MICO|nr:FHA domain-containing protein [Subtercola boreus]RFA07819.1 hypothetical protein B7R54_00280 [Subtercola boreus]TQL55333.1 FHA domain-containing protein [Subtercola boreus]
MPRQTYVPGTWFAVVSERGVALLPGDVPATLAETVWAALDGGRGLGAVLESLTGAFGTSLTAIPPFAVALFTGPEVRLAVRGPLSIVVTEPGSAPLTVSGADITTWSERVATGAESLQLTAEDATPDDRASASAHDLRIGSGVVLARSLRVDVAATSSAAPVAAAADSAPTNILAVSAVESRAVAEDTLADTGTVQAAPSPAELEPVQPTSVEEVHEPLTDPVEDTRTDIPDEAYDHLWGTTVVKSVESAAVRDLDDDESERPDAAAVAPPRSGVTPGESGDPEPVAAPETPSAPAQTPAAPADWTAPPATGLIDRVPGFSAAIGAPAPAPGAQVPVPTPAPAPDPAPAAASAASSADVDHDGLTITVSELDALRRLGGAASASGTGTGSDQETGSQAAPVSHGSIRLSTGDTVTLDRTVIVGRRPRANRVDADRMPALITVPSPEQDISRNHLEVRIEGRHVLAVDLDTTNGSVLHREGTPPERLTPSEPVLLLDGDVIDIGDGVTLAFEGLS